MALPARQQLKYWSIAGVVFLVTLWVLGDVLLPFILGGAIAYMLDPIADRLEEMGLGRAAATTLISVCFLLIVIFMVLLVVPTMIRQAAGLIEFVPEQIEKLRDYITSRFPKLTEQGSTLNESLPDLSDTIRDRATALLAGLASSAMGVVNVIVLIVIVPVVSFYLLIDWDRMVANIDALVPRDHVPVVRHLASEMDRTLASFIRGQGLVCLIQGTFYAVALMLAGLNFGLIVGAVAGLISFIPYVGSLVGGALAIGLAVFQFWNEPVMIALIAGIFFFGQMVEGNFLTPKLVGSSVGLHPVWLLLALSIFGALFGFVGMLVAVPVSAMIGVLVRFLVEQYRAGRLYQGLEGLKEQAIAEAKPQSAAKVDPKPDSPQT